jgi:hypothetical protein
VTLKAAAEATGVPATTIRNWARKHRIPSHMEDHDGGRRRLVDLAAALDRARSLGHSVAAAVTPPKAPGPAPSPAPAAPPPTRETAVPEDHVLVPLEAWEKVLLQLGNLHTAGQELADARERAARAETEASFLRERLAELREGAAASDPPPGELSSPSSAPAPEPLVRRVERRYRALAARLGRRR